MKEQEEKRKSPVTAPVRNKETAMDFTNITVASWGISTKGGGEERGAAICWGRRRLLKW